MDRNTIIAIVLSVIVITVGMTINTVFFPPEYNYTESEEVETIAESDEADNVDITATSDVENIQPFIIETDAYLIEFDPAGASVSSIKLKNHTESTTGEPVELILKDSSGKNAFLLYTGNDFDDPVDDYFSYSIQENVATDNGNLITLVDFTQTFEAEGSSFEIAKSFAVPENDEYLFKVNVSMTSLDGSEIPLDSYALGYDPQVGPEFEDLSNSYGEYRRMYYKEADSNKRRNVTDFENGFAEVTEPVGWAATAGKYFAVIGAPESADSYVTEFRQESGDSILLQTNSFYFVRNNIRNSEISDTYDYYAGPKLSSALDIYNVANNNTFAISALKLDEVLDSSSWLGWLQTILKWVLNFFHRIIPNYGVAIILLTILVKLIIQPLSKKGMDSTAKMAALSPKLEEIKTKYADNPEAMNAAMAKLYKEEGISPMGSCLPMLIQFPIFIALYGLLSTHYELRGAMFIPGWIPDLSVPDTVLTLPFSIPFLGDDIHLLPIIYTASMIFSMKITQTANTQSSQQGMMTFMTYGMPVIFFFILYNAPSGLLLYWTVMNFISILQQIYVNKKKTKKYAQEIKEREEAKINRYKTRKRK